MNNQYKKDEKIMKDIIRTNVKPTQTKFNFRARPTKYMSC